MPVATAHGRLLMTVAEAAHAVHPDMPARIFQATADRLGIQYHRLGRSRYYSAAAVQRVIEGTMECPDVEPAPVSRGDAAGGSSDGLTAEARASAAQARQIARSLKRPSKRSSPNDASGQTADVLPIRP